MNKFCCEVDTSCAFTLFVNKYHTFFFRYNLSTFYRPSFDEPDYVCSLPENNGLSKCDHLNYDTECNQSFPFTINASSCWNKYYTTCRDSGENIYWGSISFDNVPIATVAIFQVGLSEVWPTGGI